MHVRVSYGVRGVLCSCCILHDCDYINCTHLFTSLGIMVIIIQWNHMYVTLIDSVH